MEDPWKFLRDFDVEVNDAAKKQFLGKSCRYQTQILTPYTRGKISSLLFPRLDAVERVRIDKDLKPKAKRVIHVFCNGGASHIDTFDPKP